MDLGSLITVEIHRASKPRYDRVITDLSAVPGITAVLPGTFDRRGFSYLDVESRLDARILSQHVQKALGAEFALDRNTRHYIQFVYDPEAAESTGAEHSGEANRGKPK